MAEVSLKDVTKVYEGDVLAVNGIKRKAYFGVFDVETAVAELVDKNLNEINQKPTNSEENRDKTDN